ncbi:MAG: glutamate mutase L [Chloroflexota bacterium]|nr:glutamate mutase L [Chloroflexota bacterium]
MTDNSILAVDFGNVQTRALLIDLVEGVFRVVARADVLTTARFPIDDVSVGLRRVVGKLSALTGRQLLTNDGRIISPETDNRTGVDCFLATASIGRPLRTVLIGLYPEMSLASLQRAAAGTYITVIDTLNIADQRTPSERLNAIALANPDLIVIAGGTEDGADDAVLDLARLTRLAIRLTKRALPPTVLYAGNSALRKQIGALFQNSAALLFADNVRPSVRRESIEDARVQLARAFDAFTEQRGAGFEQVSFQARLGVLPTAQSYDSIVRYLGETTRRKRGGVLAIDLGSAVSTLSASVDGAVSTSIRTDIGLGHSAGTTLDAVGVEALRVWLPFTADDDEIMSYAYNKALRPAVVPMTRRALFLEHALLRAALRALLHAARPLWTPGEVVDNLRVPMPAFERVIGAGAGLTGTGRPGMTAMLMLDALQPIGVSRLQIDSNALIPALGALARINPTAVVQVLDAGGVEDLGTAISLSGTPRAGAVVVSVTVKQENGDNSIITVEGGALHLIPLSIGVRATVTVRVRGAGLNIGGRRRVRLEVTGGTAGLIIDARGRPLPLDAALAARATQIVTWYAQSTGDAVIELPDAWLSSDKFDPAAPVVPVRRDVAAPVPFIDDDGDADLDALFAGDAPVLAEIDSAPAQGRGKAKPTRAVSEPVREKPARGRGKQKETAPAEPAPETPAKEDDLDDLRSLFS